MSAGESPFRFILCAGEQHSKANADNLRAWFKQFPGLDRGPIVADYFKRGYLTDRDAFALKEGK